MLQLQCLVTFDTKAADKMILQSNPGELSWAGQFLNSIGKLPADPNLLARLKYKERNRAVQLPALQSIPEHASSSQPVRGVPYNYDPPNVPITANIWSGSIPESAVVYTKKDEIQSDAHGAAQWTSSRTYKLNEGTGPESSITTSAKGNRLVALAKKYEISYKV